MFLLLTVSSIKLSAIQFARCGWYGVAVYLCRCCCRPAVLSQFVLCMSRTVCLLFSVLFFRWWIVLERLNENEAAAAVVVLKKCCCDTKENKRRQEKKSSEKTEQMERM